MPPRGRAAKRAAALRREPTVLRDRLETGGGSGRGRGPPAAAGMLPAPGSERLPPRYIAGIDPIPSPRNK